jgi:pimeloyl-ACP methyl ester carboxylesterase
VKEIVSLMLVLLFLGCGGNDSSSVTTAKQSTETDTLVKARRWFKTRPVSGGTIRKAVVEPPTGILRTIAYDSAVGELAAYITPAPQDSRRVPAIIWITGGDCNSIGDVWSDAPPDNDQTARAFREAGIAMMYPSLRGGNQNPGTKEGFYGEVDDVLAAADYLAKQSFVDPSRIYLGGHSTGGTLAMLVAEASSRFRAIFSFGPADVVAGYSRKFLPFDTSRRSEIILRSPGYWLHCIESPVFVFEGATNGNAGCLASMESLSKNANIHFFQVRGATHVSVLATATRLIAQKILRDEGATTNIGISDAELRSLGPR